MRIDVEFLAPGLLDDLRDGAMGTAGADEDFDGRQALATRITRVRQEFPRRAIIGGHGGGGGVTSRVAAGVRLWAGSWPPRKHVLDDTIAVDGQATGRAGRCVLSTPDAVTLKR